MEEIPQLLTAISDKNYLNTKNIIILVTVNCEKYKEITIGFLFLSIRIS
jgi:hypothetical protein